MSDELDRRREAATGMLGGDEETYRELLASIVDVARSIFAAEAASIFLLDEEEDELVFEAVSGRGRGVARRLAVPVEHGHRGLRARHAPAARRRRPERRPSLLPRPGRETTGYVPSSIVASPLLYGERALGVLSVLDRDPGRPFGLAELELLSRFSTQAAIGLDLLLRARRARSALGDDEGGSAALVARVAALLDETDDDAGRRLLEALETLLR